MSQTASILLLQEFEKGMKQNFQLLSQKGMHLWHLNCSCFLELHLKIVQAQSAEILTEFQVRIWNWVDMPKFKKDELFLDFYKQLRRKSLAQQLSAIKSNNIYLQDICFED